MRRILKLVICEMFGRVNKLVDNMALYLHIDVPVLQLEML